MPLISTVSALATNGSNIIANKSSCFFILVVVLKLVFNKGLAVPLVVDGEGGRRVFPCISVLHKRGLLVMLVQRYKNIRATQTLNKKFYFIFSIARIFQAYTGTDFLCVLERV